MNLFIYLFIYLFIHGKKIHQVHKCLKIPKPKNTNPIITLIYNKVITDLISMNAVSLKILMGRRLNWLGGKRGAGVPGSRGVENTGCGKHGVWWKTWGLGGKHGV